MDGMFGPYRLGELLGRGGMGEVYRARHTEQDRVVALKLLRPELSDDVVFRRRFLRESRLVAKLTEPHVIPVHNWGEIDGRLYLDMRFVDGEDLAARLARSGPLPPAQAVAVVVQVANALDAAHRSGLAHRDVKPSNILLAPSGGGEDFAYLVDFGIAQSTVADDGAHGSTGAQTSTGAAMGTLAYMAPERFLGEPGGPAADVYALACVLHECLTGRKPFEVTEPFAYALAHLNVPPPRPSRRDPDLTRFDGVVARGLAKDPAHRHPTAGALAAAAQAALPAGRSRAGSEPPADAGHRPSLSQTDVAPAPRPGGLGARPGGVTPPPGGLARLPGGLARPPDRPAPPPAGPAPPPAGPAPPPAGPSPVGAAPAPGRSPLHPPGAGAPPAGPRSRRRVAGAAAVLVGAGSLAAAVVILTSGGWRPGSVAPASPSVSPSPSSVASELSDADRALLAVLPPGFTSANCTADPDRPADVIAALRCTPTTSDAPSSARFARFRDVATLDQTMAADAAARKLPFDTGQCRDGADVQTSWSKNGQVAGLLSCYAEPTGGRTLRWTDRRAVAMGVLTRTDGDSAALYDWWTRYDFGP